MLHSFEWKFIEFLYHEIAISKLFIIFHCTMQPFEKGTYLEYVVTIVKKQSYHIVRLMHKRGADKAISGCSLCACAYNRYSRTLGMAQRRSSGHGSQQEMATFKEKIAEIECLL